MKRQIVESEELRKNTDTAHGDISQWERNQYRFMTDGMRIDLTIDSEEIEYYQDGAIRVLGNLVRRSAVWDGQTWSTFTSVGEGSASLHRSSKGRDHYIAAAYGGACLDGILPGNMEPVDTILEKADAIEVRDQRERVNGVACYVMEATTRNGRYTLWIDPEHSYRIAKAGVMKRADDLYLREAVKHEYGDLPSGVRPAAASKRPKT